MEPITTSAELQNKCATTEGERLRDIDEVVQLIAVLLKDSYFFDLYNLRSQLEARSQNEVNTLAFYLKPYASFCVKRAVAGLPAKQELIADYLLDCDNDSLESFETGRRLAAISVAHCLLADRPTTRRRRLIGLPKILRSFIRPTVGESNNEPWVCWNNALAPAHSRESVFSEIYLTNAWGKSEEGPFYSGVGSHKPNIVSVYLNSVNQFLKNLTDAKTAVDLGCGDFNVGKHLVKEFSHFTACDIVSSLIEQNKVKHSHLGVEFRRLDIVEDELPLADVAFIRQVLQHLSNEEILRVVSKLHIYKWIIVSEHIPYEPFIANLNKLTSKDVRADYGSGVVLSAHPFCLRYVLELKLCDAPEHNGVIQTIAYTFTG